MHQRVGLWERRFCIGGVRWRGPALGLGFWESGPGTSVAGPCCSVGGGGLEFFPRLAGLAVGVFVSGQDLCLDASAGAYFKAMFPRPLADCTGFVHGRADWVAGSSTRRRLLPAGCGVTREDIAQFLGMAAV